MDHSVPNKENLPTITTSKCGDTAAAAPDIIRDHLACALCSKLVAAPLVLSCGHMFCGQCLFEYLPRDPMCPTCSMGLRAVPVRCLAVDAIVNVLKNHLTARDKEKFNKRVEEGRSAADKVNKIFWWLAPQAVPIGGTVAGQIGLSFATPTTPQLPVQTAAVATLPTMPAIPPPPRSNHLHKQPKRHASLPQLPNTTRMQPQMPSYGQAHLQQQALYASTSHVPMPFPQSPMMPDAGLPNMMLTSQQQDLVNIMQRLYANGPM